MMLTGRRPHVSAHRPARRTPTTPGTPAVTLRNTATPAFEK